MGLLVTPTFPSYAPRWRRAATIINTGSTATNPDSSGLVAKWLLDDGSGTTAADSSGNNNTLTINGSFSWVAGQFGTAAQFNGTNAWATTAASISLVAPISVAGWIKVSSTTVTNVICAKWEYGTNNRCFGLYLASTTGFGTFNTSSDGTSQANAATGAVNLADGTWHHLVGVYGTTQNLLYVDGNSTPAASQTRAANGVNNTSVNTTLATLLLNSVPDGNWLPGTLDSVRIFSRALSTSEIAYLAANP